MELTDQPVLAASAETARPIPESVRIAGKEIATWPSDVKVQLLAAPNTAVADFADRELYHAGLAAAIIEMESDPRYRDWIFKGGCGTKIRDPHEWGRPEADLIHARAMQMAAKALGVANVVVDDCWANVYRKGDYCMPHSHLRATASVVYLLDPGDPAEDDPLRQVLFLRPAHSVLRRTRAGSCHAAAVARPVSGLSAHLPRRVHTRGEPVRRGAAAHHAVLEHQPHQTAGESRGWLERFVTAGSLSVRRPHETQCAAARAVRA